MLVLRQRKKTKPKTGTGCVFSDTCHHLIDRNSRRKKKVYLLPKKKEKEIYAGGGFLFNFFLVYLILFIKFSLKIFPVYFYCMILFSELLISNI
jgi:hypothetical protein